MPSCPARPRHSRCHVAPGTVWKLAVSPARSEPWFRAQHDNRALRDRYLRAHFSLSQWFYSATWVRCSCATGARA